MKVIDAIHKDSKAWDEIVVPGLDEFSITLGTRSFRLDMNLSKLKWVVAGCLDYYINDSIKARKDERRACKIEIVGRALEYLEEVSCGDSGKKKM